MNNILKIFTSRIFTWIVLMLVQILWFVGIFYAFSANFAWVGRLFEILTFFIVLTIVNKQDNPSYKLAWTIVILALPVLGLALYALFGSSNITKKNRKRLAKVHEHTIGFLYKNENVLSEIGKRSRGASKQAEYIAKWSGFPIYKNEGIEYFSSGESVLEPMLKDIRNAKRFIFVEFFIIHEGRFLNSVLEELEKKAKEGVEVRFIYDDMGSVSTVGYTFDEKIRKRGIKCKKFNPLKPIVSVVMYNRDHRKILVFDGEIGYTGGFNLSDEYINEVQRFGYWKDTGVRICGKAVENMTAMFLEMWQYTDGKVEDISPYFATTSTKDLKCSFDGNPAEANLEENAQLIASSRQKRGYIQPYADSPLDKEKVGETVYLNIINRAKDYIYIFTPYLIIDNEMMTALCNAAKSGVDVHIICPGIPDKKIIFMMSQSYYGQLIKAGVHIHEFTPGFIHAKNFVCDDVIATVGTINLDYRSLYMHFECGVWIFDSEEIARIKEDAINTIAASREIRLEEVQNQSWLKSTAQGLLRLFSPLM